MFRLMLICVALAMLSLVCSTAYAKPILMGARLADKKGFTRFVMDIENIGEHKVFTLENPPRVVVDIPEGRWSVPSRDISEARSKWVKKIRYGRPELGMLRIVLDLKQPAKTRKVFVLPASESHPTPRLVIDFEESDFRGAAFPDRLRHPDLPRKKQDDIDELEIPAAVQKNGGLIGS